MNPIVQQMGGGAVESWKHVACKRSLEHFFCLFKLFPNYTGFVLCMDEPAAPQYGSMLLEVM